MSLKHFPPNLMNKLALALKATVELFQGANMETETKEDILLVVYMKVATNDCKL